MSFRFIIIDDAPFIRELIRNIATQVGGHCVGVAESGLGGLELIQKALPDLAFLDLVMPEKNGLEIISDAKKIWPDLKIIACSTLDQDSIIQKAMSSGVDLYLTKPFTKEKIIQSLCDLNLSLKESTT